jgi:hypothetical protein
MDVSEQIEDAWEKVMAPVFDDLATDVRVEVFDETATAVDDLYGESDGAKVFKPPVLLKARVKLERTRMVEPGGETVDIDGKVTFKTEDLEEVSLVLDFGNRVTIDTTPYIVFRIETAGQVGERFLLTRAWLRRE